MNTERITENENEGLSIGVRVVWSVNARSHLSHYCKALLLNHN